MPDQYVAEAQKAAKQQLRGFFFGPKTLTFGDIPPISMPTARMPCSSLPISRAQAPNPQTYTSMRLSPVPGVFDYGERGWERIRTISKANTRSRHDLGFDGHHFVGIAPEVYDGESSNGSTDVRRKKKWEAVQRKIEGLNKEAKNATIKTQYKVLFFARAGKGQHLTLEKPDPSEKVSLALYFVVSPFLYANSKEQSGKTSTTRGPDAKLTLKGNLEAQNAAQQWAKNISKGAPIPEKHFVSSLARCIHTLDQTWSNIYGWGGTEPSRKAPWHVKPVVKEVRYLSTLKHPLSLMKDS